MFVAAGRSQASLIPRN